MTAKTHNQFSDATLKAALAAVASDANDAYAKATLGERLVKDGFIPSDCKAKTAKEAGRADRFEAIMALVDAALPPAVQKARTDKAKPETVVKGKLGARTVSKPMGGKPVRADGSRIGTWNEYRGTLPRMFEAALKAAIGTVKDSRAKKSYLETKAAQIEDLINVLSDPEKADAKGIAGDGQPVARELRAALVNLRKL